MLKIANSPVQRTIGIGVTGTIYLPFSEVSTNYITEATAALVATAYAAWQAANPTLTVISLTPEIGYDAVTGLLAEYSATPTNDVINSGLSSTFITGADSATLQANLLAWQAANLTVRPVRITSLTGNDGVTGYLIEYTTSTAYTSPTNAVLTPLLFDNSDPTNLAYDQYSAWCAANPTLKPLLLTDYVANDGTNGILIFYTGIGTYTSAGQILINPIKNSEFSTPTERLNIWKAANSTASILRATMTCDVLLLEYVLSGTTPQNANISASYYQLNPDNPTGNDAYQVFKTANPTLKPVRLTPIIWGDGTTGILAEYIA